MIILASNTKIQTNSWKALTITAILGFAIYCFLDLFSINSRGIWQFVNLIAFVIAFLCTFVSIFIKENYKNGFFLFLIVTILKFTIALYCWNHSYSIILLYMALSFLTALAYQPLNRLFSKLSFSKTQSPKNKNNLKVTQEDLLFS